MSCKKASICFASFGLQKLRRWLNTATNARPVVPSFRSSERVTPTECPSCNISQNLARARKDGCFFTMLSFQDQLLQVINQTKETLYDSLEKLKEDTEEPFEIVKDIASAATYKKLCKAHVLN